jgi:hypothetical protein
MTTQARIGHGALFEIHNGVGFEVIGEITSISHPKLARDAIDASGIGTPGGWREFVPGMKDAATATTLCARNSIPTRSRNAALHSPVHLPRMSSTPSRASSPATAPKARSTRR